VPGWAPTTRRTASSRTPSSSSGSASCVVPTDHNWARNLCVAEILVDALERLDPKGPEPEPGTEKITIA